MRPKTVSAHDSRPLWRSWILAGVLMGLGFLIYAPRHPWVNAAGTAMFVAGLLVCLLGIAHGVWALLRLSFRRHP